MPPSKQKWYLHIDWVINWLGFSFLAVLLGLVYTDIKEPSFQVWDYDPFLGWNSSGAIGIPIVYIAMAVGCTVVMIISQPPEKKNYEWRKFLVGFSILWFLTMMSKWIAKQTNIKSASIGDSIWAIFFGCLVFHVVKRLDKKLQHCLELSRQTELYIATSLVLLVINFDTLKSIIGNSVFVAWIDTPILFVLFSYLGIKLFKLRPKQSMILSGCTVICGSSAATAIRNSLKGKEKDQKDAILISSILTIPCIIILPIIGKGLGLTDEIAGSWFGGSVDSTGAVFATSSQFSTNSVAVGAVVKMVQNILIAPISVAVVAYYVKNASSIDEQEKEIEVKIKVERARTKSIQQQEAKQGSRSNSKQNRTSRQNSKKEIHSNSLQGNLQNREYANSINDSFIKKENDQIIRAENANSIRSMSKKEKRSISNSAEKQLKSAEQPLIPKPASPSYLTLIWDRFPKFVLGFVTSIIIFNLAVVGDRKEHGKDFIFCISEWFSTCSFVSIGMSLQLAKGDGRQLMILTGIYLIIQITDILTTLGYAYLAYTYF